MICFKRKCFDCGDVWGDFFSNVDGRDRCNKCNTKRITSYVNKQVSSRIVKGRYARV